jgi:quercetin dioxygenase-like cupin family protein
MSRASLVACCALALALPAYAGEPATKGAPPAPQGQRVHEVAYPVAAGTGEAKEVNMMLDTPHLKVASITLRKGTVLAEHATPMPVTIMAVSGSGHVVVGDQKVRIEAGKMVALAPHAPHSVVPDAGSDLVVLVHHVKQGAMVQGPGEGRGPASKGRPADAKPGATAR